MCADYTYKWRSSYGGDSARPRSDFIYTKNSARPRSDFLYTKNSARPGSGFSLHKESVEPIFKKMAISSKENAVGLRLKSSFPIWKSIIGRF